MRIWIGGTLRAPGRPALGRTFSGTTMNGRSRRLAELRRPWRTKENWRNSDRSAGEGTHNTKPAQPTTDTMFCLSVVPKPCPLRFEFALA